MPLGRTFPVISDTVRIGDTLIFAGVPHPVVALHPFRDRKGRELTFHNGARYTLFPDVALTATRRDA